MPADMRALILDFGGVITRTMFETHDLTEKALGLDQGSLTWRGPFDPDNDCLWRSMQADEITEREYWRKRTQQVSGMIGADWAEMADFVRAVRGASPDLIIRPEFHAAIEKVLASRIRLAILSNELDLFYGAGFREKLPFLAKFEVIHDATYTNNLKPDSEAYLGCLNDLGLDAGQCVFVDDQARNIEGARKVGLHTVQFDVQDPEDSYRAALHLLGL
ncbi:MAG: HAD-IA family hydrolase [Hyphomicrobiales bacterium]|nr:HAD-IA family hydrolase [Hyphomicrobiales bacterium]